MTHDQPIVPLPPVPSRSESPEHIFEAVRERDIDVLILEEFYASRDFRDWWLKKMRHRDAAGHSVASLKHSLSVPGVGESDVVLRVKTHDNVHAVLVEVKINAAPQKDQALRYIQRGEGGVPHEWDTFATCLVAPEKYQELYHAEWCLYHRHVTLEELRDWFQGHGDNPEQAARYEFKRRLLDEAILKPVRQTTTLFPIPAVTAFWQHYGAVAKGFHLEVNQAPRGLRGIRVPFPGQPPGLQLVHHLTKGYVDLLLLGKASELKRLAAQNADLLRGRIYLKSAHRSAAFRIDVPHLDVERDPQPQTPAIRRALEAAVELRGLETKIRM
jgi:hypothetical protein